MSLQTAELCDRHEAELQLADPIFRDYGGVTSFHGAIATVRAPEDNSLVRKAVEEPGHGRVLVIDGGGTMRYALLGDQLAELAAKNGWSGVVVNGCIRDSEAISKMRLGVKAVGTFPRKTVKRNEGEREVPVRFAGVTFTPGHHLYADADGVIVSAAKLE